MSYELQPIGDGQEQPSSLPASSRAELLRLRLGYFSYTALPAAAILDLMTRGQLGESVAVAAFLGGAMSYWGPHFHNVLKPGLRAARQAWEYLTRNHSGKTRHRLLDKHWWLTGEASIQYAEPVERTREIQAGPEEQELKPGEAERAPEPEAESPIPAQFTLGGPAIDAISVINQQRWLYFGKATARELALRLDKMYHVLDISSSGQGKSNRMRLAMMQVVGLAETYYINPLANSVKVVQDSRQIEVWQPIFDRLANGEPVKQGPEILQLLGGLVKKIDTRAEQEAQYDFSWCEEPVFVFIDEQPETYARCPQASDLIDKIGRMGRQFSIFLWIASQTAFVKDIGLSTAAQAQFKTRIYGGGDKTSANRVMKGAVTSEQETTLQSNGEGLTLMLADNFNGEFVRAPLLTNEALFKYFGLPPFCKEDWLRPTSQQPTRRVANLMDSHLSFSSPSATTSTFPARNETLQPSFIESENEMKQPGERDEKHESFNERLGAFTERDESFIPSHEDEIAVLTTVLRMNAEGVNVTREAIKQRLGWNNAKHPVVKFVCDKYKIAVR